MVNYIEDVKCKKSNSGTMRFEKNGHEAVQSQGGQL